MNLVCLDSHYFKWGILKIATLGQEDMIPRSEELFKRLNQTDAIVVVPTPIITELLMEAEVEDRVSLLEHISSKFHVVEYDIIAAKNAADIWNAKKRSGVIDDLRKSGGSIRTKIKIDTQIIGIAMAAKVRMLYSQDVDLKTLADGYLVTGELPEFEFQMDLFNRS